ncbi:hypothetical protein OKW34_001960 [Paraburkholderia youngii]
MNPKLLTRIACAVLGACCALPFAAHATLGQNASTVDADQTRLHAVAHAASAQGAYSVHALTLPSGTQVANSWRPTASCSASRGMARRCPI